MEQNLEDSVLVRMVTKPNIVERLMMDILSRNYRTKLFDHAQDGVFQVAYK